MSIRDKIEERMNSLESLMKNNVHLTDESRVDELIQSVSKFWSALSEEDREYIQMARDALEEQTPWS